jgi:hypothetical protein
MDGLLDIAGGLKSYWLGNGFIVAQHYLHPVTMSAVKSESRWHLKTSKSRA